MTSKTESRTTRSAMAMTPSERRRWWKIHNATIDGTVDGEFALDLQARGIIELYDCYANASYWMFTDSGADLYFGAEVPS